jgi:hypothetical protein
VTKIVGVFVRFRAPLPVSIASVSDMMLGTGYRNYLPDDDGIGFLAKKLRRS